MLQKHYLRCRGEELSKRRRKSSGDNKGIYAALIVLGIAASSAAFFAFNTQMEDVVIARENIVANTEIIPEMVTTKKVDKSALPPNYIRAGEIQSLTGLYTNIGLTEGSIFTAGNLATKDTKKAAVIPDGQTLLAINISSLPKGVNAGDRVNLLVGMSSSEGRIVLTYQNVLVTGTTTNEKGEVSALEVQVTPEQAQKIQYAQLNGELAVSLLPLGYSEESLDPVNENSARNYY